MSAAGSVQESGIIDRLGVGCARIAHMKRTATASIVSMSQRLARSTLASSRLNGLIAIPRIGDEQVPGAEFEGLVDRVCHSGRSASSAL
jgi:hypothetical protein